MQGGGGGGGLPSLSELLNSKPTDSNQSAKLPSLSELLKSTSNAAGEPVKSDNIPCSCNTSISISNLSTSSERYGLSEKDNGGTTFLSLKELGNSPGTFPSLSELSKSPGCNLTELSKSPIKFTPLNELSNSPKGFSSLNELSKSPAKFTSLSELSRSPQGFTPLSELSKSPQNFTSLNELSKNTGNFTSLSELSKSSGKFTPLSELSKSPDNFTSSAELSKNVNVGATSLNEKANVRDESKEEIVKPNYNVISNEAKKDSMPSLLSLLAIENEKDVLGNTAIPKLELNKAVGKDLITLQALPSLTLESKNQKTKSSAMPMQIKAKKTNMSKPSKFAQVIGAKPQKANTNVDKIRSQLLRTYNLSSSTEILLKGVTSYRSDNDTEIFTFSTPSPDDIVLSHQDKAYQRDY